MQQRLPCVEQVIVPEPRYVDSLVDQDFQRSICKRLILIRMRSAAYRAPTVARGYQQPQSSMYCEFQNRMLALYYHVHVQ